MIPIVVMMHSPYLGTLDSVQHSVEDFIRGSVLRGRLIGSCQVSGWGSASCSRGVGPAQLSLRVHAELGVDIPQGEESTVFALM
jgi:hypothetical protein